jgi:hypothetical protein
MGDSGNFEQVKQKLLRNQPFGKINKKNTMLPRQECHRGNGGAQSFAVLCGWQNE